MNRMKLLTISKLVIFIVGGFLLLTELESCKHEPIILNGQDLPISTPTSTPSVDGATLYTVNCASCHGPLATSAKLGTSATLIQTGISTVNNMKSLSFLTKINPQCIALHLSELHILSEYLCRKCV